MVKIGDLLIVLLSASVRISIKDSDATMSASKQGKLKNCLECSAN